MADSKEKRQGDWVEALFMSRATALGLNVARPWGSALAYDFLVEADNHTCRVQVKSCSYKRRQVGGYQCVICDYGRTRYTADEFEFVAIYLISEDLWYILPIAVVTRVCNTITLSPHYPRSKYESYKEAWHLLQPPQHAQKRRVSRIPGMNTHTLSAKAGRTRVGDPPASGA
jgi:hypothetical protein